MLIQSIVWLAIFAQVLQSFIISDLFRYLELG